MLEQIAKKSLSRCSVEKWLDNQDQRVKDVFKTAMTHGLPNYQSFYGVIKEDAFTKNEVVPFAITTMKNHLQSKCSCAKIRN